MFAARGIVVCCAVFLILYSTLSFVVVCIWRRIWTRGKQHVARHVADSLFALRMFPLIASVVIIVAFTVPSFLLLEPRAIQEPLNGVLVMLSLCGAFLGIFGILNASLALRKASHAISTWSASAHRVETGISVPVLRISAADALTVPGAGFPVMTAAGILRPRILMSGAAEFLLAPGELQTALSHELAHVRRRDNLKKLLLRFVTFPGLGALETAWLEATELAADDAAVSNAGEALDLAAALIKLSRLGFAEPPVALTVALMHGATSLVSARIERLIAWKERNERDRQSERHVASRGFSFWCGLSAAAATIALFALTYSQILIHVHTATEWLVR
jgi:Zn-dependent protease with chaperone function